MGSAKSEKILPSNTCNNGSNTARHAERIPDAVEEERIEYFGYKMVVDKECIDQKREEFCTSVNRWTKELACSDDLVEVSF